MKCFSNKQKYKRKGRLRQLLFSARRGKIEMEDGREESDGETRYGKEKGESRKGDSKDKLDDWIITKGREEISEEMSIDEDGTITEDVNISNNSAIEGQKRTEDKSDDADSDNTEKRKTSRMKREQSLRRVGSTRRKFGLFDKCMSLDDES